ncbi:unnamed protein product [Rodentolepis nana]|uniref:DH domain-containing protein n=1 Tax=Rodentolepis nana TaxID=102285 RepID=A0A3P7S1B9_RODNA|nr:unnamed protein product [Rodentolepis nana]
MVVHTGFYQQSSTLYAFVHSITFHSSVTDFIVHRRSIQTLEHESQTQSEVWTSILKCQSQLGHLLPLASYLLKPVQRILKYQLLFQELIKTCTIAGLDQNHSIFNGDQTSTINHLQNALERMVQVAHHINEAKRQHDLIDQLRAGGLDVDQWGRLLLRDVFRLPAKKHACRLVLLFERAILLAKKFSYSGNNSAPNLTDLQSNSGESLQSVLEIRDVISCNNLVLIECIDKDPLAFHILPFNNPSAQKTLQAVNAEVKQRWCQEIKRVILENFDSAIPEKVKHLMLHMEDICPRPKSSDVNHHGLEDLEEHIPRRKGSSVLTSIFKRKNRSIRSSSVAKSLTSNGNLVQPSVTTDNTCDSDSTYNDCDISEENDTDAEHVALVQDAWNALMAKHSSSISNYSSSPPTLSTLFQHNSTMSNSSANQKDFGYADLEDEDDFRCIAIEINEERFAVDLPSPVKLAEFKPTSPPKGYVNGSGHSPPEASIFIKCQEASQYDTVTFGRAYEQYIAKTRSMATLSPGEMDEILRPLLNLGEGFHSHFSSNGNGGSTQNGRRLPTLASSEDCSGTSSPASSPSTMSVCQLVSEIAIDHSSKVNNTPKANGNGTAPVPSRKNHHPPPPKASTIQTKPNKETNRTPLTSTAARNEASKAAPVRKSNAISPSVKVPKSKPPRSTGPIEVDAKPALRTNNLGNGTGARLASAKKVPAPQPKLPSISTTGGNSEAASLCQGRLRAAVANLNPPECQITVIPKTVNPSKPPRRSASVSKPLGTNGTPTRPTQLPSVTLNAVRGHGHVKHLIDCFQNN